MMLNPCGLPCLLLNTSMCFDHCQHWRAHRVGEPAAPPKLQRWRALALSGLLSAAAAAQATTPTAPSICEPVFTPRAGAVIKAPSPPPAPWRVLLQATDAQQAITVHAAIPRQALGAQGPHEATLRRWLTQAFPTLAPTTAMQEEHADAHCWRGLWTWALPSGT